MKECCKGIKFVLFLMEQLRMMKSRTGWQSLSLCDDRCLCFIYFNLCHFVDASFMSFMRLMRSRDVR